MDTDNEGTPYIHRPDLGPLDGLVCFMDGRRPCDAACMAYTTTSTPGEEMSDQQGHCTLLVAASRVGKHMVIIASMMQTKLLQDRKDKEDRARALQHTPSSSHPVPRGR